MPTIHDTTPPPVRARALRQLLAAGALAGTACGLAPAARAAVATVGGDAGCTHTSLAQAVAAVQAAGDGPHTVFVTSGTHVASDAIIVTEALTLAGGRGSCLDTVPDGGQTTIEATFNGTLVTIAGAPGPAPRSTVVLEDLRLRGASTWVEGIDVSGPVDVELRRVAIEDMHRSALDVRGGPDGVPTVTVNRGPIAVPLAWEDNSGDFGGAVSCGTGVLSVHNTAFRRNHAYRGGAIFLSGCDLEVGDGVELADNEADDYGGAFAVFRGSRLWTSGGVHSWGQENRAPVGSFLWAAEGGQASLRNALVGPDALQTGDGAAIALESGSHLALFSTTSDCPSPQSGFCAFLGYATSSGNGGALRIVDSSAWIHGAMIASSAALDGAAVHLERGQLVLDGVAIAHNTGFSVVGVVGGPETSLVMRHVTMADNAASVPVLVTSTGGGGPQVEILSSILWEPGALATVGTAGGAAAPDVHCVLSSHGLAGSHVEVGADPLFAGPWDYHVQALSPAVDFCDASRTGAGGGDVDGELRGTDQPGVADRFPGATHDIGIDELLGLPTPIFADGFEAADGSAWGS